MKTSSKKFINALMTEAGIKKPSDLAKLAEKYNWKIYGTKEDGGYYFVFLHEIVVGFFSDNTFQGVHSWSPENELDDYKADDKFKLVN